MYGQRIGLDWGMFAEIREACAAVAERAAFVRLEPTVLDAYAESLDLSTLTTPRYDTAHHYSGDPEAVLAFNVTLDAVNFGSGYFPHLKKRPGMSGYFTVASSLKDYFETHGPLSATELCALTPPQVAAIFGQDLADPVRAELMRHFTEALHQLGSYLSERFGGSFVRLIEAAGGSAERLAGILAAMPYFQDVTYYGALAVPLYKRAQITPSDLALAFDAQGWGAFHDLGALTIFADNLVPHVLRVDGVLRYAPELERRIDAGELIPAGTPEEVEIRAVALHAVERLSERLPGVSARQLDVYLWNRGQEEAYKAAPRHRTRTVFY
jgi:hypothetical protein